MTTIFSSDVRCAVCGHESQISEIGSTNAFGSSDLDTRPPEMQRSTIWSWVFSCPGCSYCAGDLSEGTEGLNAIVKSPDYQARLKDELYPAKANEFLCQALIAKQLGQPQRAAWATLHAAWICDDSERHASAIRKEAVALLVEAERADDPAFGDLARSQALRVDLLRRSADFAGARALIDSTIDPDTSEIVRTILLYQKHLAELNDSSDHSVAEAVNFAEKWTKQ